MDSRFNYTLWLKERAKKLWGNGPNKLWEYTDRPCCGHTMLCGSGVRHRGADRSECGAKACGNWHSDARAGPHSPPPCTLTHEREPRERERERKDRITIWGLYLHSDTPVNPHTSLPCHLIRRGSSWRKRICLGGNRHLWGSIATLRPFTSVKYFNKEKFNTHWLDYASDNFNFNHILSRNGLFHS